MNRVDPFQVKDLYKGVLKVRRKGRCTNARPVAGHKRDEFTALCNVAGFSERKDSGATQLLDPG